MSVNSPTQTPVINDWLADATNQLKKAGIASPRLDAEIILAHSIKKPRTYLHAHNDETLETRFATTANHQLTRRLNNEPVAYIVGYKEFYGRKFSVNTDALIPRPESEDMIDILKKILSSTPISHFQTPKPYLVDVGTGSGCLGITAKLEFPFLDVTLTDISHEALNIAKQNAIKYDVNVKILNSDLLQNYTDEPNIIIANLPYVDKSWERSPETNFEPVSALLADDHGLSIIKKLILQASDRLAPSGYLIIEADPTQQKELVEYAKKYHLVFSNKLNYTITFVQKVSDY